jgi:phage baseplate assembly protein gpV
MPTAMRTSILSPVFACLLTFIAPYATSTARPPSDCEGDGCAAVAVTYDEAKGQYRVQNNSSDAWVRVTASNMAASASVCVAPGKADLLPLKSIVGSYRAERGTSCGGGGGTQ